MSELSIDLIWELDKGEMNTGKYSNVHQVIFTSEHKIIPILLQIGEGVFRTLILNKHWQHLLAVVI